MIPNLAECDALSHGANCSILCGSCINFKQCHHINGTCLNGCDRGFQGEKCKEGISTSMTYTIRFLKYLQRKF